MRFWSDQRGSQIALSGWRLGSAALCGRVMRGLSSHSHLLMFVHSHMTKRSQGHYSSCRLCVSACVCQSQLGLFKSVSVNHHNLCKKKNLYLHCLQICSKCFLCFVNNSILLVSILWFTYQF